MNRKLFPKEAKYAVLVSRFVDPLATAEFFTSVRAASWYAWEMVTSEGYALKDLMLVRCDGRIASWSISPSADDTDPFFRPDRALRVQEWIFPV